ncbi:hypothetical protein JSE7799_03540 [Jannaschia seosinensis]|uniref:Gluconate 2-dehydrogenase subunit 3 n=1 Tax=Jannaschia seosinensis TaxID=313367 RepID=A0A0M7BFW9_9RHOB|nr:gluconate 2-dehydrogenase subunit 3 family protein [Jannaschia seosinensis]CUH40803.1 hypothetical protein JSE7799_03540 [Jannaschia seosinensis]
MTSPPRRYPDYDVLDKRDSPSWDDITRHVVAGRLNPPERQFFDDALWDVLIALCDTIMPQPDRDRPIAIWIDAALAQNRTTGTRYDNLPPMREAWKRGLAALEAEARLCHGRPFHDLAQDAREALLKAIDREEVAAPEWNDLPPRRMFREVLANEIVRVYYSHPDAWSEIGFGGPASPRGYVRLGPNRRDPWEAEESAATRRSAEP